MGELLPRGGRVGAQPWRALPGLDWVGGDWAPEVAIIAVAAGGHHGHASALHSHQRGGGLQAHRNRGHAGAPSAARGTARCASRHSSPRPSPPQQSRSQSWWGCRRWLCGTAQPAGEAPRRGGGVGGGLKESKRVADPAAGNAGPAGAASQPRCAAPRRAAPHHRPELDEAAVDSALGVLHRHRLCG